MRAPPSPLQLAWLKERFESAVVAEVNRTGLTADQARRIDGHIARWVAKGYGVPGDGNYVGPKIGPPR